MPKKTSTLVFMINRLRYIAANKRASPGTQVRALDRLGILEKIYDFEKLRELYWLDSRGRIAQRHGLPIEDEPEAEEVDPITQAMIEQSRKVGGDNANKLSQGGTSGS